MDLICRRWPFAAGQKELRKKLRSAKIKNDRKNIPASGQGIACKSAGTVFCGKIKKHKKKGRKRMERKYPHLTKPIAIGNVTFRNRMFSAPMGGTDITNDGCIGPKSTAFYELRAKGGAGAVTAFR